MFAGVSCYKKNLPPWAVQFPPIVLKSTNEHALSRQMAASECPGSATVPITGRGVSPALPLKDVFGGTPGTARETHALPIHRSAVQESWIQGLEFSAEFKVIQSVSK